MVETLLVETLIFYQKLSMKTTPKISADIRIFFPVLPLDASDWECHGAGAKRNKRFNVGEADGGQALAKV